jgi:hypothetical protein
MIRAQSIVLYRATEVNAKGAGWERQEARPHRARGEGTDLHRRSPERSFAAMVVLDQRARCAHSW